MRRSLFTSFAALGLSAALFAGCSTVPKQSGTSSIARDLDRAERMSELHPGKSLEISLAAAKSLEAQARKEAAGKLPEPDAKGRVVLPEHLALYNRAATLAAIAVHEEPSIAASHGMSLTANASREIARIDELEAASEVRHNKLMRTWFRDPGIGGELAAVWTPDKSEEPFVRDLGYSYPLTSVITSEGGRTTLDLVHSGDQREKKIAGKTLPLAADLTAPIAVNYPRFSEFWSSIRWTLNTNLFPLPTGLVFLEPYDPDRIPLVLVHGLKSTAQMWRNVVNEIGADPELSKKYQIWLFSYPTGLPVAASGLQLREELEKALTMYKPKHGIVLIGHSMGGLVSRVQVTDTSDRQIWNAVFGDKADKVYAKTESDHLIRDALIYKPNPKIEREIYICSPHRGAHMAAGPIGRLTTLLIKLPLRLVTAIPAWTLDEIGADLHPAGSRRLPTSIQSLSPNNPAVIAMNKLPIQTRYHSIIGDRGRGDTPNSSDGFVEYWSSHLDGAESELIIPTNHGGFDHPMAIAEVKRILTLNAKENGVR